MDILKERHGNHAPTVFDAFVLGMVIGEIYVLILFFVVIAFGWM